MTSTHEMPASQGRSLLAKPTLLPILLVMNRRLLVLLTLLFATATPLTAKSMEHIVVSGGPALLSWEHLRLPKDQHDKWHFNFIRPARVRMEKLFQIYGKNTQITWLVYQPAYQKRQREDRKAHISNIQSVQRKFGVSLVWFTKGEDVINYINRGKNRRQHKISTVDFFLHSNKHCFMFDYSCEILGCSKAFLHESDLKKIRRSVFAKSAQSRSWGCHTGELMSQSWRKATGTRLWGAVGKTDYSKMNENGWMPILSPGGRWRY